MKQLSEADVQECIETVRKNSKGGVLRCCRCGKVIEPYQDCPICHNRWQSWVKYRFTDILEERKRKKREEDIATGDLSKIIYFDLSEEDE